MARGNIGGGAGDGMSDGSRPQSPGVLSGVVIFWGNRCPNF